MRPQILSFLLLLSSATCLAQRQGRAELDSLLRELDHARHDTDQVGHLDKVAHCYISFDPDSGLVHAKLGLRIALAAGWRKGIFDSYRSIGSCHWGKGDHRVALEWFAKAMALADGMDPSALAAIYGNIMVCHHYMDEHAAALALA
jgi:hypothetical protein